MGYSEWWDQSRDSRKKNSKKASTAAIVETKTEDDSREKSSALAAAAGNGGKVVNISTPVSNSEWIIDSGATDHMTFDSRQVSPLKSSSQHSVSTANGTSIPIIEEGSLSLTNTLNLDSVLVVPSLNYNIFSISQISIALFCVVIFWPEFYVFKDIRTRKMIGCGVRRGKLYYLYLVSKSSDELHQALNIGGSEKKKEKKGNLRYGYSTDVWGMLLLVT